MNSDLQTVCIGIWEMPRGFTLLELVITVAVLSILLVVAAPSFSRVSQTVQMQGFATELFGFLNQSKSEAVMRNTKLYVHFSMDKDDTVNGGNWSLKLTDSSISSGGNSILHFSGSSYSELSINHSYGDKYIIFDEVRGRPNGGSIQFYPTAEPSLVLEANLASPSGRIRICRPSGGQLYDYPQC